MVNGWLSSSWEVLEIFEEILSASRVPAVHRLALSRNGLAQACEGHTGEELLQLAQAANANQPFDGASCYIMPYYHDIYTYDMYIYIIYIIYNII